MLLGSRLEPPAPFTRKNIADGIGILYILAVGSETAATSLQHIIPAFEKFLNTEDTPASPLNPSNAQEQGYWSWKLWTHLTEGEIRKDALPGQQAHLMHSAPSNTTSRAGSDALPLYQTNTEAIPKEIGESSSAISELDMVQFVSPDVHFAGTENWTPELFAQPFHFLSDMTHETNDNAMECDFIVSSFAETVANATAPEEQESGPE